MPRTYDRNFKSMIINLVVNEKQSTLGTAKQFDIPIKTLEKWITAYNKDHMFLTKIISLKNNKLLNLKRKIRNLKKKMKY